MTGLINGIYPVEYFQLANSDSSEYGETFWASSERYSSVAPDNDQVYRALENGGVQTAEIKEIDLGRVRQINGLSIDIMRMPVDVTIEYDAVSASDGSHKWVPVKEHDGMPYDDRVFYDASAKSSWYNAGFYFTDPNGQMVHTRFLRITYTRRPDAWPTRETSPFPWFIATKNLRTFRYVADHHDAIGQLFETTLGGDLLELPKLGDGSTREIAQRFRYPENAQRGNIIPMMFGFSFATFAHGIEPLLDRPVNDTLWSWSVWNVSDQANQIELDRGLIEGSVNDGRCWINAEFKNPIEGDMDAVYEVRVKSLRQAYSSAVYTSSPNEVPGERIAGEFAFTVDDTLATYTPPAAGPGNPGLVAGDTIRAIGGQRLYVIASVSLDGNGDLVSITLTGDWKEPTGSRSVVKPQPLRRPPTRVRTTLPGIANAITNGSTAITYTGDIGTDLTQVLDVGDYVGIAGTSGPLAQVAARTVSSITLTDDWVGPDAADVNLERVIQLDGDLDPRSDALVNDYARSLSIRLWADVADSGRDILGNAYRYGTHIDKPQNVLDPARGGWMSAPRPSADAVEALYFDVRKTLATGQRELSVVDVLKIAPRTPGVRMLVYYTQDNLSTRGPETQAEWDNLMWTPINEPFILRKENIIELPQSIKASYIKLEFTNLRPLPFSLPTFPELPPVEYRRYPTWVEDAFENSKLRRTVDDWFIGNADPVQRRLLQQMATPIQEFQYKQREFMAALAQGNLNSATAVSEGLVDLGTQTFIDPVTASRIYLGSNRQFRGNLLTSVRTDSLLGRAVAARSTLQEPLAREAAPPSFRHAPYASTHSDRVDHSFQTLAETPMWFNRRCRHRYRIESAKFNKKAYYVGIKTVEFRRNDYTVVHDDALIEDILHDDELVILRTFTQDVTTDIPEASLLIAEGSPNGVNAYVSYTVNGVRVVDEPIALYGFEMFDLEMTGGPAINIEVYSEINKSGTQFSFGTDYVTSYETGQDGETVNQIARSSLSERLVVDRSTIGGVTTRDGNTVVGVARSAQAPFNLDMGTSDGRAIISGADALQHDDNIVLFPSQIITGVADITEPNSIHGSSTEGRTYSPDAFTVVGVAFGGAPIDEATDITTTEVAQILGLGVVSGAEDRLRDDADTVTSLGRPVITTDDSSLSLSGISDIVGLGTPVVYDPAGSGYGDTGDLYGGGSFGDLDEPGATEDATFIDVAQRDAVSTITEGADFWFAGSPIMPFDTILSDTVTEGQDFWLDGSPVAPFTSTRLAPAGVAVVSGVETKEP